MARNLKRGDIDAEYHAIRARLTALRTTSSATIVLPPHGHSADTITFNPTQDDGGRLAGDDVQEVLEELDIEKLARSGEQPMLGNLDMNHNDVNNVRDIEVEGDVNMTGGDGNAVIRFVRNIIMTGIAVIEQVRQLLMVGEATIDFTGSDGVGSSVINQPRAIHMAGDDDDAEARIDGLEAVVFNDEGGKSYIETLSRVGWNVAVDEDYPPAEGRESWDAGEKTKVVWVNSGDGLVQVAYGWGVKMATMVFPLTEENTHGYAPKMTLVKVLPGQGDSLHVEPYHTDPLTEQPELVDTNGVIGVTMTSCNDGEQVAVMSRGIIYGVEEQNGENWSSGDLLWSFDSGNALWDDTGESLTKTRPTAPDIQIYVGTIISASLSPSSSLSPSPPPEYGEPPFIVDIDVRILPEMTELSGVSRVANEDKGILVYRADANVWETRQIRKSRTVTTSEALDEFGFDHLVRVDATGGDVTVTLPPVGVMAHTIYHIKKVDSSTNAVTIDGDGTDLIEDTETFILLKQGESLMIQSDGTTWAVL